MLQDPVLALAMCRRETSQEILEFIEWQRCHGLHRLDEASDICWRGREDGVEFDLALLQFVERPRSQGWRLGGVGDVVEPGLCVSDCG